MSISKYDLIIFDCDGTLVDSEYLHNKLNSDVLISLGLDEYTTERCIHDFAGSGWPDIKKVIMAQHNVDVPQELIDARIPKTLTMMDGNINVIDGALNFVKLAHQHCKIAVGSNGEPPTILKSLELQGFMDYFEPADVFSKNDVPNPKPAPDLFLYAAQKMGVDPQKCLVIEDSAAGATAGVAAGMDVFGYTGVSHDKPRARSLLTEVGVTAIFDDFIHMGEALKL